MCIAEAASALIELKKVDSADGKFEDFLTAGVRTAQLVAAGARAASDVAGAVLNLCRSGSDDRDDQCGVSNAGPAGSGSGIAAATSTDCKWQGNNEFGPTCGESTGVKSEPQASTSFDRKPKRGRPKKEADAAWSSQCPKAAKWPLLETN